MTSQSAQRRSLHNKNHLTARWHTEEDASVGRVRQAGPRTNAGHSKKAEELSTVSITSAVETVQKLEVKLTEFAKKHKKEIQNDPAFRARFLEMCAPIGVDPLSSEKGLWGSALGIGDFHCELSVKAAEVCMASRSRNGGVISASEARDVLMKRGTRFHISSTSSKKDKCKHSEEDTTVAIGKLSKLGSGLRCVKVGKTITIVSVPTELDSDHMEVMEIAQNCDGTLSSRPRGTVDMDEARNATGWTEERAKAWHGWTCTRAMSCIGFRRFGRRVPAAQTRRVVPDTDARGVVSTGVDCWTAGLARASEF